MRGPVERFRAWRHRCWKYRDCASCRWCDARDPLRPKCRWDPEPIETSFSARGCRRWSKVPSDPEGD